MKTLIAMTRREMGVYFVSPIAYIILTFFLAVSGMIFYTTMLGYAVQKTPAGLTETLQWIVTLLTLLCPLVTMRLIAEEKNRGTIETLMTAPVAEWQFVLAKYFAALLFTAYLLLPTAFYAVFVSAYSTLDLQAVLVGYAGVLLTVGAILAIGLFISALSGSQITAGVVTLIIAIGLMLASWFSSTIRGTSPWITAARETLSRVGILDHVTPFSRGVVDTGPLVYLLSVIVFFLFVTVRAVESRRWR